nr:hypothetical protein GCM10017610_19750 [Curtobacterium pusillum]
MVMLNEEPSDMRTILRAGRSRMTRPARDLWRTGREVRCEPAPRLPSDVARVYRAASAPS